MTHVAAVTVRHLFWSRGEWGRLWESAAKQGSGAETLAKYAGLRVRSVLDDEASWEKVVSNDGDRWGPWFLRFYTHAKFSGFMDGSSVCLF